VLKKGELVEAIITNLEPEKEKLSISMKALTPDPWVSEIPERYHLGDQFTGTIIDVNDSGVFVEFDDGVEGLVYASEINDSSVKGMSEFFKTGKRIDVRVINIDTSRRRLGLSLAY
jgi:small subunit ribosomal protein S1